jgi:3-oxoacyl-[acyl-carrier-protein] synthase-3
MPTPFVTKEEHDSPLLMKGRDVFRFAVTTSVRDIRELVEKSGLTLDDVNWFMIHQANLRIVDAIREGLGVEQGRFPTNIADHGNSSSASCPILLDECNRKGMFKPGDILVFSACGAGLLSAAAVLEW